MRLAAISDTHSNAVAFEAVIADLKRQSPDAIVFLGDVVTKGPQPAETLALLRDLNPLLCVRGNYDEMMAGPPWDWYNQHSAKHQLLKRGYEYDAARLTEADREWLATLPSLESRELEGVKVEFFHASPWSNREITWPWSPLDELVQLREREETQLVVFGHIHHAYVRTARGRQVVNCGSVGLPFDGDPRPGYAIIDLNGGDIAVQIRRVSYDRERAVNLARDLGMPDLHEFTEALRTAYYPY